MALTYALLRGTEAERMEGIERLKAYTRHSGSIESAIHLGKIYSKLGDEERARRWFCFAGEAGERVSPRPIKCDGKYIED
jgi:hypothetical protein